MILRGDQVEVGMRVKYVKYVENGAKERFDPPGVVEPYSAWADEPDDYFAPTDLGISGVPGGWRPIHPDNRFKVVR